MTRRGAAWLAVASLVALCVVSAAAAAHEGPPQVTSAAPANLQGSPEEQLVAKYAPVLYLVNQESACASDGDAMDPAPVDIVLDRPGIPLKEGVGEGPEYPTVIDGPSMADLFGKGPDYFLDFPGDPRDAGCTYEQDYLAVKDEYPATSYAHIAREDGFEGFVIQYWFFYYLNDWNNTHEGDWETITLVFEAPDAAAALDDEPERVIYSQHGGGEKADWDSEKLKKEDGRPVVFTSAGSHASYFSEGLFLGNGKEGTGFGCDDTTGDHRRVQPEAVLVPTSVEAADDPNAWLGFQGRWGQRLGGENNGPTGPNMKSQWTAPFTWEEGKRDTSLVVPGAGLLGQNASGTFCNGVAWGAEFLGNVLSAPAIISGTVVFLLLGAVATTVVTFGRVAAADVSGDVRTRPFYARKRNLPGLIRSALYVFRRHFLTFMAISLVFVVVGVLVAAVQSILFGIPPLKNLVEAADQEGLQILIALVFGAFTHLPIIILVTSGVIAAVGALSRGEEASAIGAYKEVAAHFWTLFWARLKALAICMLLFVSILGVPWGINRVVRWYFLEQAILLDGADSKTARKVSADLVEGRWWWRTFGITFFFGSLVSLTGPVVATLLIISGDLSLTTINGISAVITMLILPVVGIALTLLYFDLKERDAESDAREQPSDEA